MGVFRRCDQRRLFRQHVLMPGGHLIRGLCVLRLSGLLALVPADGCSWDVGSARAKCHFILKWLVCASLVVLKGVLQV